MSRFTEEEKQRILTAKGLDPSQYYFDETNLTIKRRNNVSPTLHTTPSVTPKPSTSATGAFGRHAAQGIIPSLAGLGAAGITANVLPAMFTGGGSLAVTIPATIAAGVGAGYGAHRLQAKALPERANQRLAEDFEAHPLASSLGGLSASLVGLKPDHRAVLEAGKAVRGLATGTGASRDQFGNLLNVGVGAGLGGATSIADDVMMGEDIDWTKLAAMAAGAGLINNPNRIGQALGLRPNVYTRPIDSTVAQRAEFRGSTPLKDIPTSRPPADPEALTSRVAFDDEAAQLDQLYTTALRAKRFVDADDIARSTRKEVETHEKKIKAEERIAKQADRLANAEVKRTLAQHKAEEARIKAEEKQAQAQEKAWNKQAKATAKALRTKPVEPLPEPTSPIVADDPSVRFRRLLRKESVRPDEPTIPESGPPIVAPRLTPKPTGELVTPEPRPTPRTETPLQPEQPVVDPKRLPQEEQRLRPVKGKVDPRPPEEKIPERYQEIVSPEEAADIRKYNDLVDQWRSVKPWSDEHLAVWGEIEKIKNKYGGMPPGANVREDGTRFQEASSATTEPTVAWFNWFKNVLGPVRNVDLQTPEGLLINPKTGKEVRGAALAREGVKAAVAKVNPMAATWDTPGHEFFHHFISDSLTGPSAKYRKQAKELLDAIAKKEGITVAQAEERFTQRVGEETVTRLMEDSKLKNLFKDFWANMKTKWGNATEADYARLWSNRLVNDPPFSETHGTGTVAPRTTAEEGERFQPMKPEDAGDDLIRWGTDTVEAREFGLTIEDYESKFAPWLSTGGFTNARAFGEPEGNNTKHFVWRNKIAQSQESGLNKVAPEDLLLENASGVDEFVVRLDPAKVHKYKNKMTAEELEYASADSKERFDIVNRTRNERIKQITKEADEYVEQLRRDQEAAQNPTERYQETDAVASVVDRRIVRDPVTRIIMGINDRVAAIEGGMNASARYVANKLTRFTALKSEYEGKYGNVPQGELLKYDTGLKQALYDKLIAQRLSGKKAAFIPEEQALNSYLRSYLKDIHAYQRSIGMQVAGREAIDVDTWFPGMMSTRVQESLTRNPNSIEALGYKKAIKDHWKTTRKLTEETAEKEFNEYLAAIGGTARHGTSDVQFNALRKAMGFGLPKQVIEPSLDVAIYKYGQRVAKDLAYFETLQNNESVRHILGIRDQQGNLQKDPVTLPVTGEQTQLLAMNPDVITAMRHAFGLVETNPRLMSMARMVSNTIMGVGTGIRDVLNLPALMAHHLRKTGYKPMLEALTRVREARQRAFAHGATKINMQEITFRDGVTPDSLDKLTQKFNTLANLAFKWSGRQALEKFGREYTFAVGEIFAETTIPKARAGDKAALKALKEFDDTLTDDLGGGIEAWITGKFKDQTVSEEVVGRLAKRFTDKVQQEYNPNDQPWWTLEGPAAPFFALPRWSIGKANSIYKEAIVPATEGNFGPLLTHLLGTFLTGAVIQQLNAQLNQKKDWNPTLKELYAGGAPLNEAIAGIVNISQLGAMAGIMSDTLKIATDVTLTGQLPRGFNVPFANFASDIAESTANLQRAIIGGTDPIKAITAYAEKIIVDNVQTARIIANNTWKKEEASRSDKFRDLRIFNRFSGDESDMMGARAFGGANPFARPEQREFKRTDDLAKAAELLPGLIQQAIARSKGNPMKLERELRSIKQNSYRTMPNPDTMPQEFFEYLEFLTKTKGESVASERLTDYILQNEINRAKASMVP